MQHVCNPSPESESVESHLDIELLELLQVEPAGGTVLQETLVPLLQLMFIKLCVLHQVLHHFRGQLAVLFPHFACKKGHTCTQTDTHTHTYKINDLKHLSMNTKKCLFIEYML